MSKKTGQVLSRRGLSIGAIVLIAGAGVIVFTGISSRKLADAHLNQWTEKQAIPVVKVITPDARAKRDSLDLPGRLEAYSQAQIYSRVSGYLRGWNADIGAKVKAGQILAEIDAPDLDQQIAQAQAELAGIKVNAELARTTLERGESLIKSGAMSQQVFDQRKASYANLQGVVKSSQANLDRLRVLEKYKQISAPFDGVVSARSTDVGALINSGSGGGPALFVVSDISKLRAFVNVPQRYAPSIGIGTKADISVPEYPDRRFVATVEASSQAVDAASGTTRMQLVVENAQGALMTGAFANIRLQLAQPETAIAIPSSALIFDQKGLRVAVVGADDRVTLKGVTIARDFGQIVEIGLGVEMSDRIIESPPDGIATGDQVRVVQSAAKPTS